MNVLGYVKYAVLLGAAVFVVLVFGLFEARPSYHSFEKTLGGLDSNQIAFACVRIESTEYVNASGDSVPSVRFAGVYEVAPLGDLKGDHTTLVFIKNRTMSNLVKTSYLRMQEDRSQGSEWTMGLHPLTIVMISRLDSGDQY